MAKYVIGGREFKNQSEIKQACREIIQTWNIGQAGFPCRACRVASLVEGGPQDQNLQQIPLTQFPTSFTTKRTAPGTNIPRPSRPAESPGRCPLPRSKEQEHDRLQESG